MNAQKRVRAWDISGTLPSDQNPDPDYTVGVLMSKDKSNRYCIEDVIRDRRRYGGVLELIIQTAKNDGSDIEIIIPRDPGAAGLAYASQLVREIAEEGFSARMRATNQSKVTRFAPFASCCEAGGVDIVKAPWNDILFHELEAFDGSRKGHDDICDAVSDAFMSLTRSVILPNMSLPDYRVPNPINEIRGMNN